jgi:hypothetical protein
VSRGGRFNPGAGTSDDDWKGDLVSAMKDMNVLAYTKGFYTRRKSVHGSPTFQSRFSGLSVSVLRSSSHGSPVFQSRVSGLSVRSLFITLNEPYGF